MCAMDGIAPFNLPTLNIRLKRLPLLLITGVSPLTTKNESRITDSHSLLNLTLALPLFEGCLFDDQRIGLIDRKSMMAIVKCLIHLQR